MAPGNHGLAARALVGVLGLALLSPGTVVAGEPADAGRATGDAVETAARSAPPRIPPGLAAEMRVGRVPPATAAASTSAIVPGSVNRASMNLRATYDVSATVRYNGPTLAATSTMVVTNTSGGPIDRLELNAATARLGRLRITGATVDGRAVSPRIDDQTIHLPLGGILPAGSQASVVLRFGATFRTSVTGSNWLFTRASGILSAYRWIPWISRARPFDRRSFHGDPFVTPVSPAVKVTIRTDRAMKVATSGRRVSGSADGRTHVFRAANVRDFNFTASPTYRTYTTRLDDTQIVVYFRSSGSRARTMMSLARRALSRLEAIVGPYQYPTLTVVESSGGFAMESPAHVWIPYGQPSSRLSHQITHEVAHQFFYAAVGNDQTTQPYADEAVAEFLTRYVNGTRRASRCSTDRLDRTIYEYSRACYFEVVYVQGGNFLDDLRRRMGSTAFWRGLRGYYRANLFAISGTKRLLDALDAATPLDLVPRFAPRFPRFY